MVWCGVAWRGVKGNPPRQGIMAQLEVTKFLVWTVHSVRLVWCSGSTMPGWHFCSGITFSHFPSNGLTKGGSPLTKCNKIKLSQQIPLSPHP